MSENTQVSKDEQNWAMFCHLAALSGFVIPLGNVIGPLVVWLIKKDTMPLVNQHGKDRQKRNEPIEPVERDSRGTLTCIADGSGSGSGYPGRLTRGRGRCPRRAAQRVK